MMKENYAFKIMLLSSYERAKQLIKKWGVILSNYSIYDRVGMYCAAKRLNMILGEDKEVKVAFSIWYLMKKGPFSPVYYELQQYTRGVIFFAEKNNEYTFNDVKDLVQRVKNTNGINPVVVVIDEEGSAYASIRKELKGLGFDVSTRVSHLEELCDADEPLRIIARKNIEKEKLQIPL